MASAFDCKTRFEGSVSALLLVHQRGLSRSRISQPCARTFRTVGNFRPERGQFKQSVKGYHGREEIKEAHKSTRALDSRPSHLVRRFGPRARELTVSDVKKELRWLQDPVKLADYVKETLQKGDFEKASALTRISSRTKLNLVSWNHLIDADMKAGRVVRAFEQYHDLKKRGLKPDGHTYTILLRGLAANAHVPSSLGRALGIYNALRAPKSAAAPTIIHVNATLSVAARAGDMDSMWHILSELPEKGPHAPDQTTFTTMLNAMRMQAMISAPEGEELTESAMRKEACILEGRRLWAAIIARWRSGDVKIDEGLVTAMGRLLLCGMRPRDWDDVLSLIQQTMKIPRLVPILGTSERAKLGEPRVIARQSPPAMRVGAAGEQLASSADFRPGEEVSVDVFEPNDAPKDTDKLVKKRDSQHRYFSQSYARPGSSTLSLIMDACLKMVAKKPALAYWELLTDKNGQYAVSPDLDNMHMYLRILRQSRASRDALTFISEDFQSARLTPSRKSYHLALASCVLDALNPNALETAARLIDHATQSLAEPGALCYKLYLQVGLGRRPKLDVPATFALLEHLQRVTQGVRSLMRFGSDSKVDREDNLTDAQKAAFSAETQREREAAFEVFRAMVTLYDRALDLSRGREVQMGTNPEQVKTMDQHKRQLSAILFRHDQERVQGRVKLNGFRATGYNPMKPRRERPARLSRNGGRLRV